MEPIRGPLDYHRYPPRNRNRNTGQHNTSATSNMPNQTPNQSPRPAQAQPAAPLQPPTAAAQPHNSRAPGDRYRGQPTTAPFPGVPFPSGDTMPRASNAYGTSLDDAGESAGADATARRQRTAKRRRVHPPHSTPASADAPVRHRMPPHSMPHSSPGDTDDDQGHGPQRIRRKRRVNLFFSRGHRKRLGAHQAYENALEPPPSSAQSTRVRRPLWLWVRRGATLLFLAGCVELIGAALTSPRMKVREVRITGLQNTPEAAVQPIAASLTGQNWIRARVREAARNLAALPTVRSAQVVRVLSWPPRLEVQVEERQPFARVGAGKDWWVVDEAGIPFRRASKSDASLYAVTAPTLQPTFGQPLASATWRPVVEFATALSTETQKGHDWKLRRIYFDKQGFASLRLAGGVNNQILVRLGNNRWPEKLERARAALAFFERTGRHALALNLISYSRPTWTPRTEPILTAQAALSHARQPVATSTKPATAKVTTGVEAGPSSGDGAGSDQIPDPVADNA